MDAEGPAVDALPADTRAVYVTPAHQFPLCMPMSDIEPGPHRVLDPRQDH
ncbi:hypothetical protein ACIQI8_36605 [Streptomyces sp. NPDC092369]